MMSPVSPNRREHDFPHLIIQRSLGFLLLHFFGHLPAIRFLLFEFRDRHRFHIDFSIGYLHRMRPFLLQSDLVSHDHSVPKIPDELFPVTGPKSSRSLSWNFSAFFLHCQPSSSRSTTSSKFFLQYLARNQNTIL